MTHSPARDTFLCAPFVAPADLAGSGARPATRFAFLGLPLYVPYGDEPDEPGAGGAADAVRAASAAYAAVAGHHDFDLGGPLVPPGVDAGFVDCGDVALSGAPEDLSADLAACTAAVRDVVAAGAVPLVVAGDHSVPPVVVRGLPGDRPIDILHVDAHLDFRDEVAGLREGYSSPIRRLRESSQVATIVQVGLRDVGSARDDEVRAARAAGNVLVGAGEVHEGGAALLDELAARFDSSHRVYITVDVDGLDPSCAPGTLWPAPGGLWYWQLARLVRAVGGRCELAGVDVCEFAPSRDPWGHTALAAARLLMLAAGASLRRRA
jgi:agmatinase